MGFVSLPIAQVHPGPVIHLKENLEYNTTRTTGLGYFKYSMVFRAPPGKLDLSRDIQRYSGQDPNKLLTVSCEFQTFVGQNYNGRNPALVDIIMHAIKIRKHKYVYCF